MDSKKIIPSWHSCTFYLDVHRIKNLKGGVKMNNGEIDIAGTPESVWKSALAKWDHTSGPLVINREIMDGRAVGGIWIGAFFEGYFDPDGIRKERKPFDVYG